jgi:hypothetical protein
LNLQHWLGKRKRCGEARFVEVETRLIAERGRHWIGFGKEAWQEVEGDFDERGVRVLTGVARDAARSLSLGRRSAEGILGSRADGSPQGIRRVVWIGSEPTEEKQTDLKHKTSDTSHSHPSDSKRWMSPSFGTFPRLKSAYLPITHEVYRKRLRNAL